jgi:hypothetical protein
MEHKAPLSMMARALLCRCCANKSVQTPIDCIENGRRESCVYLACYHLAFSVRCFWAHLYYPLYHLLLDLVAIKLINFSLHNQAINPVGYDIQLLHHTPPFVVSPNLALFSAALPAARLLPSADHKKARSANRAFVVCCLLVRYL